MRRVWLAQPDPGEHQSFGVFHRFLTSPSGQRASDAPTEDEAHGPTQASADTGPPIGHDRDQTEGSKQIPSLPSPCLPHRPRTSARHANLPACPDPLTSAAHLRHHV